MNETSSPVFAARAALQLGAALLAGVALMLVLAMFDQQRRTGLESMEEVTAVGDKALATLPAAISWQGQPLLIPREKRASLRDTRMHRVGRDEAAGISIYEYRGPASKDAPPAKTLYLKTGVSEYVRVLRKDDE